MAFSLRAEMLLGTYRGRRSDRQPDRFPSVARLQSALICAAGLGPRAVHRETGWGPCDDDEAALRWIEENPPTDVTIPALSVRRADAVAYRDDGTIGKTRGARSIRKLGKQESTVAVGGAFVWTWATPPPAPVARSLRELCPDVPHLGSADSPVVLSVDESEPVPTHVLDPDADLFDHRPGTDIEVPTAGRLAELEGAYRAERTGKVGSDRPGTDERSSSPTPPRRAVRRARYRSTAAPSADVPWSRVLLVPLSRRIPERERVRCAVAAHRAMAKVLDQVAAPPILTGTYPENVTRPANRIALQILDRSHAVTLPADADSALAVLVPRDAPESEIAAVYQAVGGLRTLRPHGGRRGPDCAPPPVAVLAGTEERDGDRFWNPPPVGHVRLWRTEPAAVPDTRGRRDWTFVHAALLSVGYVWQGLAIDRPAGRGRERDEAFVDAVNAAGVAVVDTEPVRTSRVEDVAHRWNAGAVVRPYRARLALGDLGTPTTVQAIGQARHLGGGLLVPEDHRDGEILGGGTR